MKSFMTRFVVWSGVYNVGLASILAVGLNIPRPLVGLMLGGFLAGSADSFVPGFAAPGFTRLLGVLPRLRRCG
jgi:hypothetical protein